MYREPVGPGGSTLPIKPKRERIPADTGSLKDAPKVKKRFSQLSKDIKGLKVDRDIDKEYSKNCFNSSMQRVKVVVLYQKVPISQV